MGLCQSSEEDNQEHRRSNEIDKLIEKEKSNREKECKILLLGNFHPFFIVLFLSSSRD
jgi:guanine nucleotide-binding protein G(i) subunit alpha